MADADKEKFLGAIEAALAARSFVKLTLAKYRGAEADLRNVYVRPVALKKGERLSFLRRYKTKDVVKNLETSEGLALLRDGLGADFLSAHLFTTEEDLRIEFNRRGEARLVSRPPSMREQKREGHERRKHRFVEAEESVYLRELGVTNERGEVRPAMGEKFRQINKFVEIVAGLLSSSPLAGRKELSVVDMGSGKGYLTFAVYDYLNNSLGVRARVAGVEARAELVEICGRVARLAGFERLEFRAGDIGGFELESADVLIALHACDTATDDAIHKGVSAGASVIITAPCCHKEVRPQMSVPDAVRGVLRHGILLERAAEAVTDSLRALLLERAGYRVKVFEFVSSEHTRKNTMIAAVRRDDATDAEKEAALREFQTLKGFYGIREQRLEKLFCENFSL